MQFRLTVSESLSEQALLSPENRGTQT